MGRWGGGCTTCSTCYRRTSGPLAALQHPEEPADPLAAVRQGAPAPTTHCTYQQRPQPLLQRQSATRSRRQHQRWRCWCRFYGGRRRRHGSYRGQQRRRPLCHRHHGQRRHVRGCCRQPLGQPVQPRVTAALQQVIPVWVTAPTLQPPCLQRFVRHTCSWTGKAMPRTVLRRM